MHRRRRSAGEGIRGQDPRARANRGSHPTQSLVGHQTSKQCFVGGVELETVVGPTLKWLAQLRHKADADCMVRNMAQRRILTPGYVVVYPNREKAASKLMKLVVTLILLASVGLMLIITIGGWSKLQGLKPVNIIWSLLYVIIAFYVFFRWSRGLLPIAAALGILLLILAVIAATGVAGTSWFDRNNPGFGAPHTLFGGKGLDPNVLGVLTVILAIVQLAQIVFAMIAFSQAWNVEVEVPEEEAKRRGYKKISRPGQPATA
jgi:hypothetical protein